MGVQFLMWIGCRSFGLRLISTAAATGRFNAGGRQYSIRQLFIGVSLFAVMMSVVRVVLPNEAWELSGVRPNIVARFMEQCIIVGGVMLLLQRAGIVWATP